MQWRKWSNHFLLLTAIIIFIFVTFKWAAYFIDGYKNKQIIEKANTLFYDVPEITTTTQAANDINKPEAKGKFQQLLKINKDVVGWIHIDQTAINYPVLQSNDNTYYLSRDLYKEDNVNGSIIFDYRNHIDSKEKHWVIYGHNMKNQSMFMSLLHYESQYYFDQHPIIEFDTLYNESKWKIFSVYYTNTKDDYIKTDFKSDGEYSAFIMEVKNKSLHSAAIDIGEQDRILTLSTCAGPADDGRFVVHAKLISN